MAQGLWLIDVGTPIRGHVKNSSLLDLPNGFVEILPGFFSERLISTWIGLGCNTINMSGGSISNYFMSIIKKTVVINQMGVDH